MKKNYFVMLLCLFTIFTHAASCDCAKAATDVEKTICSNPKLSLLDELMVSDYKNNTKLSSNLDILRQEQKTWRTQKRDVCKANLQCLVDAYNEKISGTTSEDLKNYFTSFGWKLKSENWQGHRFCLQIFEKNKVTANVSYYCAGGAYNDMEITQ